MSSVDVTDIDWVLQDDAVLPSGSGSTSEDENKQDRPSDGDNIYRERDTIPTSRRRLSEVIHLLYMQ